jgi:hypothetical protein
MATRCSLQIRNVTRVLHQAGIVRSLRVTTGIISPQAYATSQDLLDLAEHVRNHARTRTYSGAELAENKQINCTVVDQSRATTFLDFGEAIPSADLNWWPDAPEGVPVQTGGFTRGIHNPTYTPIILLFETTSQDNEYEISIRSQFLAHYVQGSMLANLATTPLAIGDKLNAHRDHEERKGSILHDVGEVVKHVGHWAMEHRNEVMGAVGMGAQLLPLMG